MPRIKYHKFGAYAAHTTQQIILHNPPVIGIDTETTGLKWIDRPFGVSVCWQHPNGDYLTGWYELDDPEAARQCWIFFKWMYEQGTRQIYFNAKFDIRMLMMIGMLPTWPDNWEEVLVPAAYTNPSGSRGLKDVAKRELGMSTNQEVILKRVRKELKMKKEDGYFHIPREYIIPYAEKDAEMTLRLWFHYNQMGVLKKYHEQYNKEKYLLKALCEMEYQGLQIDVDELKDQIKVSDKAIASYLREIEQYVGRPVGKGKDEFNPNSHVQVKAWAQNALGIVLPDTTAQTLLAVGNNTLDAICQLKKEEKLVGTYLRPMLREIDRLNILHPNWNQFGTSTGRLSSSGQADR